MHENYANNGLRYKYNKCLATMAAFHRNVVSLHLKKVWDPTNLNLYLEESCRYTAAGWTAYWEAVDRTVKYADTILCKKGIRQHGKKSTSHKTQDRYRWRQQNNNGNHYQEPDSDDDETNRSHRRRLPKPPQQSV